MPRSSDARHLSDRDRQCGRAVRDSVATDELSADAHEAMADLLGARPEEIAFGPNMTSLTFAVSRALARDWQAGDELIVTRLDHDANVAPWLPVAADRGMAVRWLDFDPRPAAGRSTICAACSTPQRGWSRSAPRATRSARSTVAERLRAGPRAAATRCLCRRRAVGPARRRPT